jgi:hypothetical protein
VRLCGIPRARTTALQSAQRESGASAGTTDLSTITGLRPLSNTGLSRIPPHRDHLPDSLSSPRLPLVHASRVLPSKTTENLIGVDPTATRREPPSQRQVARTMSRPGQQCRHAASCVRLRSNGQPPDRILPTTRRNRSLRRRPESWIRTCIAAAQTCQ